MNKRNSIVLLAVVLVAVLGGVGYYYLQQKCPNRQVNVDNQAGGTQNNQANQADEAAVKAVVKNFGYSLKNVSLLSPTASADIEKNYKDFVVSRLLTEWENNPAEAPGRLASSPWPDRIEIAGIGKVSDLAYNVTGKIIEVTSREGASGEVVATRAIILLVNKVDGKWLISNVSLSPEATNNNGWKTTSVNGIEFQYPENLATRYIATQSWPPAVKVESGNYSCTPSETVLQKVVNGRIYCISAKNEGAAGSTYATYIYTTPKNGKLVELSFVLRYPQCANYIDAQKQACTNERQSFDLDALVDQIVQTVKWDVSQDASPAVQLQGCLPMSDMQSKEKCDALLGRINEFISCIMAGFSVTNSDPPECQMPDGRSFKEK